MFEGSASTRIAKKCSKMSTSTVTSTTRTYTTTYSGFYTHGHEQGNWGKSTKHDNLGYAFDTKEGRDFLTTHNNAVHAKGYHRVIACERFCGISIQVRCSLAHCVL